MRTPSLDCLSGPSPAGAHAPETFLYAQWAPLHAAFLAEVMRAEGHDFRVLPSGKGAVQNGLTYANNDLCYSELFLVGQVVAAISSGEHCLEDSCVLVPETCVRCLSRDLGGLVKKALGDLGYTRVPVCSLFDTFRRHSGGGGIQLGRIAIKRMAFAFACADLIMQVTLRLRPYGQSGGSLGEFLSGWTAKIEELLPHMDEGSYRDVVFGLVRESAERVSRCERRLPVIGVTGTIPLVFCREINGGLIEQLENEGCEVRIPYYSDYVLHGLENANLSEAAVALSQAMRDCRAVTAHALRSSSVGYVPAGFEEMKRRGGLVAPERVAGPGWLLAAHMLSYIEDGVDGIVYARSFGCLAGHVMGSGILKEMRLRSPETSIASIEYDAGASGVNQLNRIKLLTAVAKSHGGDAEVASGSTG